MLLTTHQIVYLVHILVVGPLLIYLWYVGAVQKKRFHPNLLVALGAFGLFVIAYHGYKLYVVS